MDVTDARVFDTLPTEQRRRNTLRCLASLFGDNPLNSLGHSDTSWSTEEFAPREKTVAV